MISCPKNISSKKKLVILIIINIFIACVISEIYGLLNNTLENNGRWYASKDLMKYYVMGSGQFLKKTQALARCRLDLGAWHGHQEVIYKKNINPQEIEFRFMLKENSYLYFIFNKDDDNFSGIRVSRNLLYKNIYFTADRYAKFIGKSEISVKNLKNNKWNRANIIFGKEDVSLFINHMLVGVFKEDFKEKQSFGFRSGAQSVFIDDILIKQKDSPRLIRESFHNNKYSACFFIAVLAILGLINLISFLLLKEKTVRPVFYIGFIDTFILGVSIFFTLFVNSVIIGRYYKINWIGPRASADIINCDILSDYGVEPSDTAYRIIYLGSSQAFGVGARTNKGSFVKLAEKKLNNKINCTRRIEFINLSVCASDSSILLEYYKKNWIKLNPKITIIHLSNNDKDPELFYNNLREIINLNQLNGIRTIFVLEANSIEHNSGELSLHRVMRKVGKECNIFTIDLHEYLKYKYDSGILWWDFVHLAPYGHKLAADFLFENILNFIKPDAKLPQ